MLTTHIPGFPRIGQNRELKKAVESYWKKEISQAQLEAIGAQLRAKHWRIQQEAGLSFISVGDFAWYDHVLNHSLQLGVIPARFGSLDQERSLDLYFRMARGRAPSGTDAPACEMTKWFDTNYHYIVPELEINQTFNLNPQWLLDEIKEAQALGHRVKPILLGPLTYLWLSKTKGQPFDRLILLERLIETYGQWLKQISELGVEWVQIDEPILAMDLPQAWQSAFESVYHRLQSRDLKLLLTTYFDALENNLTTALQLPVAGFHVDGVRAPQELSRVADRLAPHQILSAGVVDGRNVWRNPLQKTLDYLMPLKDKLGDRLWIASSCSLLHCPVDLEAETSLGPELKTWLAFSVQKVQEIVILGKALAGDETLARTIQENTNACLQRESSTRIHNPAVKTRLSEMTDSMASRASRFSIRQALQKEHFKLPPYPTTTIGSFPQTKAIRTARASFKRGKINLREYEALMEEEIRHAITVQEELGLDVLVHGEAERNDMVEYFGEQLQGYLVTQNGWVQSYGSRCVKPPIIYGDVQRSKPMTLDWTRFAQSLTDKPLKGMLTGPVTLLCWSFVRDDQSRSQTALQIALALRDEVRELELAGIKIIQIDEPAFREGLPLRKAHWQTYLQWAVRAFKVASCGVSDTTQIHTHMCYSEFNDIIEAIAALDADVITIETSRSDMELLEAFERFEYPNEIGPGVYDIHSPRVPDTNWMRNLIHKAQQHIPAHSLWVNPDCGLKTRDWPEVKEALSRMVQAARTLREEKEEERKLCEA